MSYADLITQAILSSPDQRLTLSQIYEWMVANVPYFADKGDSNSSAGWKVSNVLNSNGSIWALSNQKVLNNRKISKHGKLTLCGELCSRRRNSINFYKTLADKNRQRQRSLANRYFCFVMGADEIRSLCVDRHRSCSRRVFFACNIRFYIKLAPVISGWFLAQKLSTDCCCLARQLNTWTVAPHKVVSIQLDCRMDDSPFTTEFRDRCNTWPLKCLLAEESQSSIPEPFQIQCYEDSNHSIQSFNTTADSSLLNIGPTAFPTLESWATDSYGFPPTVQAHNYPYQQAGPSTSAFDNVQSNRWDAKEEEDQLEWNSNFCRQSQDSGQRKMNPWGEASYADLITKALENAPNKRLKLNEIYQWFSDNVPYFHERSTPELSAGWKVRK